MALSALPELTLAVDDFPNRLVGHIRIDQRRHWEDDCSGNDVKDGFPDERFHGVRS